MPVSRLALDLSPEHDLLLSLARRRLIRTLTGADGEALPPLPRRAIDERAFLEAAARHRLLPLVWDLPADLPAEIGSPGFREKLRAAYLLTFRTSLQIRGECKPLLDNLADAGIMALAFKGPVIGAMAYENEGLRSCTDLDLLIRKTDVERAVRVLGELGFEERNPLHDGYDATWDRYLPHHRPHGNANGYVRGRGTPEALHLDLHWGIASRYFLIPWDPAGIWERQQVIRLPGGEPVPTFSDEDTLLFLCVHAAKDNYDRLRLVADIAAFLYTHPTLNVNRVLARARSIRCEHMVGLGLSLAADLFDAPLDADVRRAHSLSPNLLHRAIGLLFSPRRGVPGLIQRAAFHLRLRDRVRDGLGTVFYQTELSLRTMLGRATDSASPSSSPPVTSGADAPRTTSSAASEAA
jgi:hypothetical protein